MQLLLDVLNLPWQQASRSTSSGDRVGHGQGHVRREEEMEAGRDVDCRDTDGSGQSLDGGDRLLDGGAVKTAAAAAAAAAADSEEQTAALVRAQLNLTLHLLTALQEVSERVNEPVSE